MKLWILFLLVFVQINLFVQNIAKEESKYINIKSKSFISIKRQNDPVYVFWLIHDICIRLLWNKGLISFWINYSKIVQHDALQDITIQLHFFIHFRWVLQIWHYWRRQIPLIYMMGIQWSETVAFFADQKREWRPPIFSIHLIYSTIHCRCNFSFFHQIPFQCIFI